MADQPFVDRKIAELIARSRRLVWNTAERRLSERGETMLAWRVMKHLLEEGPCTQREIAESIAQHPAGISRVLEELEEKGFAKRERDETDRRCSRVSATAKGKRWFSALDPDVGAAVDTALAPLTPEELRTLRMLLMKLLGDAPDGAPPAKPRPR